MKIDLDAKCDEECTVTLTGSKREILEFMWLLRLKRIISVQQWVQWQDRLEDISNDTTVKLQSEGISGTSAL